MTGGNWLCLKSFDLNLKLQLYDVKLLRDQIPMVRLCCSYVSVTAGNAPGCGVQSVITAVHR
jgi:hypothetical protein